MAKRAEKIDRRRLRQPDEFQTLTARALVYGRTHWKLVASVAGAICLVVVGTWGYRAYRSRQEFLAAARASEAIERFSQDPSQTAPFERILQQFPGTRGGRLARLYLAHVYYRKGELEKAAGSYAALAADSSAQTPVRTQAVLGQGYALVGLKRCRETEAAFAKLPASALLARQEAFLAIGRCHELKGDLSAALKQYEAFAARFPQSPYLTDALRARVRRLQKSLGSGR